MTTDEKREVEAANTPALEGNRPESPTDRVLFKVRLERADDDARLGMFRDFPDGTAGRRFHGPGLDVDKENVEFAQRALHEAWRAASPSWRLQLELAAARVFVEADEPQLEARLIELAAVTVAWVEGIRMRADRRRTDAEAAGARKLRVVALDGGGQMVIRDFVQPAPFSWWKRLVTWLSRG